jgi:cobalt-zinc-cadmium resistance protein CzcA
LGAETKEVLEEIPGTREGEGEVEFETTGRAPMLEIRVKRDVLAKYNLHAGDVNQVIASALGGQTVGTMVEGNRRFDIVVRLDEKDRENLDAIRALPVRVGGTGIGATRHIGRNRTHQDRIADPARLDATPIRFDGQPARARRGKLGARGGSESARGR